MYALKSPELLLARLTEVEKISLRRASEDRLHWLFHNQYFAELKSEADLQKVQADLNATYAVKSQSNEFGRTWAF